MDLELLTRLIKLREHYCSIESKLYLDSHAIQLVHMTGAADFVTRIESLLSEELKERAKEYYKTRIEEVNKEIEELYKEENTQCLNQIN